MLFLSQQDKRKAAGGYGEATAFAMSQLITIAEMLDCKRLIDVTQVHLVGSYHSGPANISLLERLVEQGAKVVVPTTLNAGSADLLHPQGNGESAPFIEHSCEVVQLYQSMGCRAELTCAPYHLPTRPTLNENIAWAESNAVTFANSVLGARTNMSYQYLDLFAALTGRMPEYGLYLPKNRAGQIHCDLQGLPHHWLSTDAFFPLLGYVLGRNCKDRVPVITGLPASTSEDQLRALSAAASSAGCVPLFHAVGITPEAETLNAAFASKPIQDTLLITAEKILQARSELNTNVESRTKLGAICLGAPHFSVTEFRHLLTLLRGRSIAKGITFLISTSRHNYRQLSDQGTAQQLKLLGVEFVTDRCSYYGSPFEEAIDGVILTDSAKWAYYGPSNLNMPVTFARLEDCVISAVSGQLCIDEEFWRV